MRNRHCVVDVQALTARRLPWRLDAVLRARVGVRCADEEPADFTDRRIVDATSRRAAHEV